MASTPVNSEGTALTRAATAATVPNPLSGTGPTDWCMEAKIGGGVLWATAGSTIVMMLGTPGAANSGRIRLNGSGNQLCEIWDSAAALRTWTSAGGASQAAHTIACCLSAGGTITGYLDGVAVAGSSSGETGVISTQPASVIMPTSGVISATRVWAGGYRGAP